MALCLLALISAWYLVLIARCPCWRLLLWQLVGAYLPWKVYKQTLSLIIFPHTRLSSFISLFSFFLSSSKCQPFFIFARFLPACSKWWSLFINKQRASASRYAFFFFLIQLWAADSGITRWALIYSRISKAHLVLSFFMWLQLHSFLNRSAHLTLINSSVGGYTVVWFAGVGCTKALWYCKSRCFEAALTTRETAHSSCCWYYSFRY